MPKMGLSHLETSLLMALVISVVLGITTKKTQNEQLQYGLKCMGYFVAGSGAERLGNRAEDQG